MSPKKNIFVEKERLDQLTREKKELQDHNQHLEHVILQLQSETETIGKIKAAARHS